MTVRIPQDVAVETIKLAKWLLVGSVAAALGLAVLPLLHGTVSSLRIGSVVELGFIEQTIIQSRKNAAGKPVSEMISAQPAAVQQLLIDAMPIVGGKTVLWIDDKPENNTAVRFLLEEAGLRFEVASSTEYVESLIKNRDYALVISDSGPGNQAVLCWFKNNYATLSPQPPWVFYSSTIGGKYVDGAAFSTNKPYDLIHKVIELASRPAFRSKGVKALEVKWYWFASLAFVFLLTAIFLLWVIGCSALPREHGERP